MARRTHRAVTLIELMLVVALSAIIAVAGTVSFRAVISYVRSSEAKTALIAVSRAQDQLWRKYGQFSTSSTDLSAAESAYSYVGGSDASTAPGQISVAVAPGGAAVGMATLTTSGDCLTVMRFQPQASRSLLDSSAQFVPSASTPCTGAIALTMTGQAW